MELIVTTADQLTTLIQRAVAKALVLTPTPPTKPDRCTFDEALEITGLSKSKLYKLTSGSSIPFKRYGNRLIFSRKELLNWVENQTVDPSDNTGIELTLARSARRKKKGVHHA